VTSHNPTCGTCKHWGAGHDEHEEDGASIKRSDVFKPCGAVIQADKWSIKYDENNKYMSAEQHAKAKEEIAAIRARKAVVVDGSDYFAALKTCEDFGCVLWCARE
jgi:hypothetical protein